MSGQLKTLIVRNAAGTWLSTTTISPGDVDAQIIGDLSARGDPAGTAELCTARRSECRTIRLIGDSLIDQHGRLIGMPAAMDAAAQPVGGTVLRPTEAQETPS